MPVPRYRAATVATAVLAVAALLAVAVAGALGAVLPAFSSAPARDGGDGGTGSGGAGAVRAGTPTAVFVGDSITVGYSDLEAGDLSPQSWFTGLVSGAGAVLRYAGAQARNGETTGWMAGRVDDALAGGPDWLVVLGGTNDVTAGVPVEESMANVAAVVDRARSWGARVAVATIPPQDDRVADVAAYNDALRALAAERGAVLLDTWAALAGDDGRWADPALTADGIHPTAAGASRMAARAAADLGPALA